MDPFIGEIRLMAFNFDTTDGWLLCDGRLLEVSKYQALFALLGTRYGGDGTTNFAIPDLRGRVAMHTDSQSNPLGYQGGKEWVTLTTDTMPPHTHTFAATSEPADKASIGKKATRMLALAAGDVYGSTADMVAMDATTSSFGGAQSHSNMQPSQVLAYCIASKGIFPPRS